MASRNGRRWVIDPVDGTFDFFSGLPTWCSAVAPEHDGVLLAGAVDIPAARKTWTTGHGRGMTVNGGAVEPLADKPLRDSSVASHLDRSDVFDAATMAVLSQVMDGAAILRISGSGTADLAGSKAAVDEAAERLATAG